MDEAEIVELVAQDEVRVAFIREGNDRVLPVVQRELGIQFDIVDAKLGTGVENALSAPSVAVVVGRDVLKFRHDCCRDVTVVGVDASLEEARIEVGCDAETHETGRIRDQHRHLYASDIVDVALVELLFQHPEVRGLLGADERLQFLVGDLIVVVGGRDLLGERVVVGGVLQVLAECRHEDVGAVLAQNARERVGPVDQTVWRPELDALLVGAHRVYVVSQST
jgi:hypothetical protein